ncbi:MAG: GGDEF domain-containing protein [Lachnospiraceae bacterium]|nr:GGDEF domain-containing protein [Lachnospiraceae bacterium]
MRSLGTRITIMVLCVLFAALVIVTACSAVFIMRTESRESDQLLLMLCETGEKNLEYYFDSVQKSVGKVATFVEDDLQGLDEEELASHVDRVRKYFDETASKTNGVLTYYYRIDPSISDTVKGFWYTDIDGKGFKEHEVTDITLYDVEDTSKLIWFTVPKYERKPVWLPPYITENLDMRVISYDVPIIWKGQFIGVVGIELDYSVMADQVDSIRIYDSGYAFINDSEGNLFYHPYIDVASLTEETKSEIPGGVAGGSTFIRYKYEGVEKEAVWLPLSNGMRLNITVPVSETRGDWKGLIWNIIIVAAGVLVVAGLIFMFYMRRITRPLEQLTEAAEQADRGIYDYDLRYSGNDELGRLTSTFRRMSENLKEQINDLNKQVFVDALTSAKNKGAFTNAVKELQEQVEADNRSVEFAIGVFDCDNLKFINDQHGHDKGDIYLKTACRTIGRVFKHSPLFRVGGDEFAVILTNEDYSNMDALFTRFDEERSKTNQLAKEQWQQVQVSTGFAIFNPLSDRKVIDVVRRADKIMYEDKRERKSRGSFTDAR